MTTKIKVYQVDVFTNNLFSGNPAAVCLLDNWLPDKVMQSIALENNLSETAFLVQKKDKFFLRWFTPKVEIDLCGHATLASAHIIYSEMNYKTDYIEFNIKSGDVLTVNRNDNLLTMNFPAYEPKVMDHSLEDLYNAFGVRPKSFLFCKYGLAVFNNEEEIIKIVPNFNVIEKLYYEGIIVTAPAENVDFVSRFFAPKLGIPEDNILLTKNVKNTDEEAKSVKKLLNKKDIEIILVTSAFHMPRAKKVFEAANIKVIPFAVDFQSSKKITFLDFIPSASALSASSKFVKEMIGRLYYNLKY